MLSSFPERSMEFLYLPSTERNYNVVMSDDNFIKPSTGTVTVGTSSTSTKKMLTSTPPSYTTSGSQSQGKEPKEESSNRVLSSKVIPGSSCLPNQVDFCQNISIPFQNHLDEGFVSQLRAVVDLQCYPDAAHFLCSSTVACSSEEAGIGHGRNGSKFILPCRDYCEEFLANCGQHLPPGFRDSLKCGKEWKGGGSCVTKPGCVAELYNSGQGNRICDGLMG